MIKFIEFKALNKVFATLNRFSWKTDIDDKTIYKIAKENLLILAKEKSKNKFLFRAFGQSGSGKTTQIFPALQNYCDKNDIKFIHFAVRNFANLHPNYDKMLKIFGKNEIREKTNGFSLKCLVVSLIFALENDFDIIVELTILGKTFEKMILNCLKNFNYNRFYFCIATNDAISDFFIQKRLNESNKTNESGRIIYKSSSLFFKKALNISLKFLAKKDKNSQIVVWNVFDEKPIYFGKFFGSTKKFLIERKKIRDDFKDPYVLSQAKKDFLLNNLKLK